MGEVSDSFDGDGPLLGYTTNNPNSLPDVARVGGRYRANLTSNANDITLHYNDDQGRLDAQLVSFPFTYIARNIGIGTQQDSQTAPNNPNRLFNFCGVQVHVTNLSSRNSSHVVVGHRGFTKFTIEGKNTNNGSSSVNDDGANVLPLGRADIKIEGTAERELIVSWQAPNLTGSASNDSFNLYNGTGDLPGPTPNYGEEVYIGLITYAFGSSGIPFVGTCDSIEFDGSGGSSSKVDPVITWSDPDPIVAGTALGGAQLNASANVAGTFAYSPPSGTLLSAGSDQALSVTFTPNDTKAYNVVEASVTIDVTSTVKLDPVITWSNPESILFGILLGETQLNASANVAGTFVYSPPSGTLLSIGSGQTLSVTFTPNDTAVYNVVESSVTIDVTSIVKGDPALSWAEPSSIVYGMALGGSQLNAGANVSGTYVYSPPIGTLLPAGSGQTLSVTFTPYDTVAYEEAEASVTIDVIPANLQLSGPTLSKTYGAIVPNISIQATGLIEGDTVDGLSVPPTVTLDATAASVPGDYPIVLSGAADSNYTISYEAGSLTVLPAPLTLQADDQSRSVDRPNPELTVSASGFVLGEGLLDLASPPQVSTDAVFDSPIGEYAITISGAQDPRYDISQIPGVLKVKVVSAPGSIELLVDENGRAMISFQASAETLIKVETSVNLADWVFQGEVQTDSSGRGLLVIGDELEGMQKIFLRLSE